MKLKASPFKTAGTMMLIAVFIFTNFLPLNVLAAETEMLVSDQSTDQKALTVIDTHRTLTNNCSEKAYDILKNAGVWDNKVAMPKTITPNQMSKQFEVYQKAEQVYSIFNKSYEPLIQGTKTIKNNK